MVIADKIALLSMVGTCISATASLITLFFARTALKTWKEQEILKSKKDFKMALLELKFVTLWQPSKINPEHLRVGRNILYSPNVLDQSQHVTAEINAFKGLAIEFEKFEDAMQICARHWFATEKIFKGSSVEKLWMNILHAYNEYTQGKIDQDVFMGKLDELINVDLYFNSPS